MSTATAKFLTLFGGGSNNNINNVVDNNVTNETNDNGSLVLKAPQQNDIKFFNETGILQLNNNNESKIILFPNDQSFDQKSQIINENKKSKVKKKVTFPEDGKIIKDYSEPPKRGWTPGTYTTIDLLESYLKSCERHRCKPLNKLIPHLKALQDLDCANGEKVNVLNLKSERLDSKQMEALEEIFKRLSFKTIDLESSYFDDDSTGATLFEILQYYDTCERLILASNRSISLFGWQELSKFIRKSSCIEYLDLRGHTFPELIYFTYIARSFKLTQTLRVIHLEFSNIQGRYLLMLAAALKDNELIKEVYLSDNKLQSTDGNSIATLIKENNYLELIDLKNNNLQDIGLSHICSGLSEKTDHKNGLKTLVISNNNITANGISYLSKALIHNRSLTTLNIGQNSLTNEAIYELKEALIVNKQISGLYLNKTKLTDEGIIALAEYIAETASLNRLDLRENDIRLGGLMALASSLKFNKTLFRLDLDRDPKRETSIKDSIETSKRFIQDINEYCFRNKRIETERELALKEQAHKEEEKRKKLQDIEKEIVELSEDSIKDEQIEIPTEIDQKYENEMVNIADDEKLLKKILNRNLSSAPGLMSPMSNMISDDLMNYLNIGKENTDENENNCSNAESEYQLVEPDLNSHKEETLNDVKIEHDDIMHEIDNYFDKNQDKYLLDEEKNDILETAKKLVESVVRNTQQTDFESKNETINTSLMMNDSSLANFDDSNDLSQSIERETLTEDQESLSEKTFESETNEDQFVNNNIINGENISTSINEEDDSDIEVLTVSSKTTKKDQNVAVLKLDDLIISKSSDKSAALLNSITEQEVECLITNKSYVEPIKEENPSGLINNDFDENESAAIMSNYDLVTDHPQPWSGNSFHLVDSAVEKESSLNDDYKLLIQSNVELTSETTPPSTPNTDLILASSPFTNGDITSLPSDLLLLTESNKLNKNLNSINDIEKTEDLLETTNANILNDINNKPFFASELTNSQMSEELSHEIGLLCE